VFNKVKEVRLIQGKAQNEMAAYCDVTRQTIHAIETQSLKPSVYLAIKISKFLSVKVEDIFFLEKKK
jgi:putative transcriptional regulator